jgi:hypothetical protein
VPCSPLVARGEVHRAGISESGWGDGPVRRGHWWISGSGRWASRDSIGRAVHARLPAEELRSWCQRVPLPLGCWPDSVARCVSLAAMAAASTRPDTPSFRRMFET